MKFNNYFKNLCELYKEKRGSYINLSDLFEIDLGYTNFIKECINYYIWLILYVLIFLRLRSKIIVISKKLEKVNKGEIYKVKGISSYFICSLYKQVFIEIFNIQDLQTHNIKLQEGDFIVADKNTAILLYGKKAKNEQTQI